MATFCGADSPYIDSCLSLSTTATSLQMATFWEVDSPYIDSCLSLSTTATSLQMATFWGGQSIHWLLFKPLYNGHLSTDGHFLGADSPYIDSCLDLSTTATFFCPQCGCCGEEKL